MPVWYSRSFDLSCKQSLDVDCLVPRWADLAHYLTDGCRVVMIVQAPSIAGLRWLTIKGTIRQLEAPEWTRVLPRWFTTLQPDALFLMVRVTPSRIDLIDEDLGWGVQETVEW